MSRIHTGNIAQHGGQAINGATLSSLKQALGPNHDGSINGVTANAGDHFALERDYADVPFCMVDIQLVPGAAQSDDFEYFWSFNPDTPSPIPNGTVVKNGAYAGLYHNGTSKQASYATGQRVWFIARALNKVSNTPVHLVGQGLPQN